MKDFKGLGPLDYVRILWHRRWYALAGFILVGGGVGFYAWRTPQFYRSESRILVESAVISPEYVTPSDRSTPEDRIAAIRQEMLSRSFIEALIQELSLFGSGRNPSFSMDNAVAAIVAGTQVVSTSRNTFTISFSSTDPKFSQKVVRGMVERIIASNSAARIAKAQETDEFVDDQLKITESALKKQEDAIKIWKQAHLGELPEQSNANLSALSGLQAQLAAAESAIQHARDQQKILDFRGEEERRLGNLTRNLFSPSPKDSAPEAASKAAPTGSPLLAAKQTELSALSAKYTPSHPDVIRLAREIEEIKRQLAQRREQTEGSAHNTAELTPLSDGEKKALADESGISSADAALEIQSAELKIEAEALRSEIAKREKEKEALLAERKRIQDRLNIAPALEQDFLVLSRERETLRQQYGSLQAKKFQAGMTASVEGKKNSDTPYIRTIDEANLPEKPSFPNRTQIAWTGLMVAIFTGLGAAFVREMLDSTLGGEREAAAVLKLPVLASISDIPKERRRIAAHGRTAA
jgi:polysaccharide chain length determinant protein (PEP-CTERM system associated)